MSVEMDKGERQKNQKSKILVFGGTGYLGKYMVKASASLGHETYVYTRPVTSQTAPSKLGVLDHFKSMDVTIVQGELDDDEKIVSLLEQVDVVISTLAYPQCLDQLKVIEAMKAAGNIKRFFPSDFGVEEDRVSPLPPFEEFLEKKRMVRRATEAAGIPYTYVAANCCGAYFVNHLLRPHEQHHDVRVYGSGEALAVLNYELDIAVYTIKLVDDPRACNRVVIYRPEKNIISQLQLISLWEKKTGLSFNRVHIPEEDLVNLSKTLQPPNNIPVSILHSLFVKGDTMSYKLDKDDLEISVLYPDYDYTSIDGLLDIFIVDPPKPATATFE